MADTLDWGDGRYERTAAQLEAVAELLVETAGLDSGARVLDVGCGTGNVALSAARRGASVTAIDPAKRLVGVTRERGEASGLAINAVVGDAAAPGVVPASIDVALANFSIIFAPDASAALAGVFEALRSGGRFLFTTWVAGGPIHDSAGLLATALGWTGPSPWATEESIATLLAEHADSFEIHQRTLAFEAESAEAWFVDQETNHPFWRFARGAIDEPTYAAIRPQAIDILAAGSEAPDRFVTTSRYRLIRATKA